MRITTGVDADTVTLTVENTGPRLSPQLVATLEEPFQRGTGRVRTDQAGVGLGLAIVKSIVQATTAPSPSRRGRPAGCSSPRGSPSRVRFA